MFTEINKVELMFCNEDKLRTFELNKDNIKRIFLKKNAFIRIEYDECVEYPFRTIPLTSVKTLKYF